jgi:PleD family two-component response regulator
MATVAYFFSHCRRFRRHRCQYQRAAQQFVGKNEELGKALEMVREMAIRDELTGLFNRRHIMEILQQQQALADSGDYRFCLVLSGSRSFQADQ